MFMEELPAIISVAVLAIVFFTAWRQDVNRLRAHLAAQPASTVYVPAPGTFREQIALSGQTPSPLDDQQKLSA